MKKNIDYFTVRVLKENAPYIAILCVLVLGFIFSVFFFTNTYEKNNEHISSSHNEIAKLKNEAKFINYRNEVVSQGIDINEMNKFFTSLVPETEDFFSIVAALERLSVKTGFIIDSYSLNIRDSTKNKLSITIHGLGNADTFLNFLKDYNFVGGRLVTVDTIKFSKKSFSGVELQANFYNQKTKVQVDKASEPLSAQDKKLIEQIKDKITIDLNQENTEAQDYSIKPNPF